MNSPDTSTLEIVAPDDKLLTLATDAGLAPTPAQALVASYKPLFATLAMAIKASVGVAASVKDATCLTEIKQAKACRLAIKNARIAIEANRKTQKASALLYGSVVDQFAKLGSAGAEEAELALQNAEETAARAEAARLDAMEAGRKAALAPYVANPALYSLRTMDAATFAELLNNMRGAKEAADAAKAKAEADRLAAIKAEADRIAAQKVENDRLAKLAAEQEAALKAEREAAAKAQAEADAKLKAEQDAAAKSVAIAREAADLRVREEQAKAKAEADRVAAVQHKERLRLQGIAEVDRITRETEANRLREATKKAESAAQDLRDAETKRIADAAKAEQDRIAAEAEAARKAAAAPDKTKLLSFASAVHALAEVDPKMATPDGKKLFAQYCDRITSFVADLRHDASKL